MQQVSGCPTVVIPAGIDATGVPIGIQIIGRRWHDKQLLAIVEAITAVVGGFQSPAKILTPLPLPLLNYQRKRSRCPARLIRTVNGAPSPSLSSGLRMSCARAYQSLCAHLVR